MSPHRLLLYVPSTNFWEETFQKQKGQEIPNLFVISMYPKKHQMALLISLFVLTYINIIDIYTDDYTDDIPYWSGTQVAHNILKATS